MALLVVPRFDPDEPWPTLGGQVCDLIEERMIFGPGSLGGEQARLHDDWRAVIHAMYEVYPKGHQWAGRRRYDRCGVSVRKGLSKTELMAWLAQAELHPEGPVRCDGFDAHGNPVGRPVRHPYIPLLAVTVEQVEELAYGALHYMVTEGPDSDLFDASLERIIRLSATGADDGRAVALSNSPGARDGARTTFQGFDEPHRLFLPRQRQAHETMLGNMSKRILEEPWSLYVGTAGEPGQGSIAEDLHEEAVAIDRGTGDVDERFFYFYRWAKGTYDLAEKDQRIAAAEEATGPVGEFGPGQYERIAANWTRKGADKQYLERVWLNRWVRSNEQAFDPNLRESREVTGRIIEPGAFVTVGFDGARMRDSTGFVLTDIVTGLQQTHAVWEKPIDWDDTHDEGWEIDEDEVDAALREIESMYDVWRGNFDPPHWNSSVNRWAGDHEWVEAWYTNRTTPMAHAVKNYRAAMDVGEVEYAKDHPLDETFAKHMAAAGRLPVNVWDDDPEARERGQRLFILRKLHPDRKFDLAMAAILSWEARIAALAAGAQPTVKRRSTKVRRLR